MLRVLLTQRAHQDGSVPAEALHSCGLCDICRLAGRLHGHRRVPRAKRRAAADNAGVPDGRQEHELPAGVAVAHRFLPVGRGHHRRPGRNLLQRDSVLVHRLRLRPGPPHPGSCVHSGLVQTSTVQCLPGMHIKKKKTVYFFSLQFNFCGNS